MRLFGFRLGLLIGGIIGYVLGARAGRQRYDQIAACARSAAQSGPAQQLGAEVRQAAGKATSALEEKATEGVTRISDWVRSGSDGKGTTPTSPA